MTLSGRAAYRDELTRLAAEDERIVCLEADLGGRGHPFQQAFPDRFFNVGIAEGAMIDMAAGLAAAGFRPFVSTFAPFAALRAAESIKLAMGYYGAGITVVAPYAGVSGAWFGTTHHCLEDVAVLSAMPGITIAAPYGEREMRAVIRRAARTGAPHYVRTGRNAAPESLPWQGEEPPPVVWDDDGAAPGRVCLVSVGEVGTELCLAVRRERPDLPHAHLCYLDRGNLSTAAAELSRRYERFVVVEEHRPGGGTASALALLMPGREVRSADAGDRWPSHGGSHEDVLTELGLTETAVWRALAACGEARVPAAT
ncbi:transketolase family protein [Catenuloplanes atrovinosus]|uniref:Transketolase n=1 Tax=Catenuloplanes atrovinosus TaxID=137266 RepID=A0AAE3YN58_9ACTN|nr:transketolase [Catenuloplanes atrovinosus]MDR7275431.1 transketolase [Catenuloplanes atrovinosus]